MNSIKRSSHAVLFAAAALVLLLTGCSSTIASVAPNQTPVTPVGQTPPATSTSTAPAAHKIITITKTGASPSSLTVKVGTLVVWQNSDTVSHKISISGGATSPAIAAGSTATHTFPKAGSFKYTDPSHSAVHGTVIVTK